MPVKARDAVVGRRHRALVDLCCLCVSPTPSASLDADTERIVADVISDLQREGRTVVVVAHRPALINLADHIIHLEPVEQITDQDETPAAPQLSLPGLRP